MDEKNIKKLPYAERIRRYNEEKQSAILLASSSQEVEWIIQILQKKWRV